MSKKLLCLLCAVMILNALCCCSSTENQASSQPTDNGQLSSQPSSSQSSEKPDTYESNVNLLYLIPTGDTTKVVDENGVLILEEFNQVTIVSDLLSGQQKYICVSKKRTLSESEEEGAAFQYEHKIYDLSGNLVYDWTIGRLIAAWDDRVLIYDYTGGRNEYAPQKGHATMLDLQTGETLFSATGILHSMAERHFIFYKLITDSAVNANPLNSVTTQQNIYDLDAQISFSQDNLDGYITPLFCVVDEKEYFCLHGTSTTGLLDENGNTILKSENIKYAGDHFVICGNKIIQLPSGETIFTANGEITAFYGDRIIYKDSSEKWYLADMTGNILMGGYDYISPTPDVFIYNADDKPKYFHAGLMNSGTNVFDYDGKPIFAEEGDALFDCLSTDLNIFSMYKDKQRFLIDENKNVLYDDCDYINPLHYNNQDTGCLFAGTYPQGGNEKKPNSNKLIDTEGTVIMKISSAEAAGPDRLIVQTAFRSGLIDTEGNWIVWWPNVETLDAQS